MKKKLRVFALMLVAALAVTFTAPAATAWAEDALDGVADVDLLESDMCCLGGGGNGRSSSPAAKGNASGGVLNNSAIVLRGGMSTAANLQDNQRSDIRGFISANSGNGVGLSTLATSPSAFKNGQISVTTVGEIRAIGMDVIPDATATNPYHVAIVPNSNPLSATEAAALSNVFSQRPNTWR